MYIKCTDLSLTEYNPRKVRPDAIERLKKSIGSPNGKRLFEKRPVLANKRDGRLVVYAGNQRLKAAMDLGWSEVPCDIDEISIEEEKERNIKDNLVIGDWDASTLDLNFNVKDLADWGMDPIDLDFATKQEETSEVPALLAEPRAQKGHIYNIGRHRLMCGDSTQHDQVMALMGERRADMVFTDPPYGVDYEKKALEILGRKDRAVITGDDMGKDVLQTVVFEAFKNIESILAEGGKYYVCSPQGGELGLMMMMMMMDAKIECRHMIVWKKDSPVFSMGRLDYDYQHEPILYGWKGSHKHYAGGDQKTSVWDIPRPKVSKLHPTMKPVELIINAIKNSTLPDMLIADLFLGSGSTLIASEQTGRVCYGMEIDPRYCDVIIERYCNYTGANKDAIYDSAS